MSERAVKKALEKVRREAREVLAHRAGGGCEEGEPLVLRLDGDGIPAPRVEYQLSAETRANLEFQIARATEAHEAGGAATTFVSDWYPTQGWHLLGTARCGKDPATSVVDDHGEAHDVPNLFIVDGSVFVTSGPVNPTPTICAFALRAAEKLISFGPGE